MLDPKKVKIGIAPIAWTEDDMPEMGAENSFLQTISEIALTGYVGTEIGCQFPRDPAILNKEFGRRGISAISGWISTYLNELPMWQNERAFVDHMNFLKSIGATIINTSDQSFSIQHQWNTPLSNKKVLNDDEWEVLTKGLDHLGKIAYDSGMKIVYHHHMTTTVQKTDEIDFPTVFKLLDEYNYEGWLVVEAEQDPAIANPLEYARMARAYVKEHTGL